MNVFTKSDLNLLYQEEVYTQTRKCVENIVYQMKNLVITKAKEGITSVTYKDMNIYYNDEWVKTQILCDLKRIFPDSSVNIESNSLEVPIIIISINWS